MPFQVRIILSSFISITLSVALIHKHLWSTALWDHRLLWREGLHHVPASTGPGSMGQTALAIAHHDESGLETRSCYSLLDPHLWPWYVLCILWGHSQPQRIRPESKLFPTRGWRLPRNVIDAFTIQITLTLLLISLVEHRMRLFHYTLIELHLDRCLPIIETRKVTNYSLQRTSPF